MLLVVDVRWDDYRNCPDGYRWQPLNGGHRALGDCRTVVERLKEMAGSQLASKPAS